MLKLFSRVRAVLLSITILGFASPSFAALNILATTPEWGALATEIGGDKVSVYIATTALQDVHHVEARPSLMARAQCRSSGGHGCGPGGRLAARAAAGVGKRQNSNR